jgi:hypothetical protein
MRLRSERKLLTCNFTCKNSGLHRSIDFARWFRLPCCVLRALSFFNSMADLRSAGAVGFRQRSENGHLCQTLDLAQQLAPPGEGLGRPGGITFNTRFHELLTNLNCDIQCAHIVAVR